MKMKTLLATLALLMCVSVVSPQVKKPKTQLQTSYDKVNDQTTVSFQPQKVEGKSSVKIAGHFSYPGRDLTQAVNRFGIVIYEDKEEEKHSKSEDKEKEERGPQLFVLADGARFTLALPESEPYGKETVRRTFVASPEWMEQIANAKKVELTMGDQVFALRAGTLNAFRNLVARARTTK
ncbi:MAG: hypothetical protein ABI967_16235 [bacterium]